MYRHYASSRYVIFATMAAGCVGVAVYFALPNLALEVSGIIVRNLWVVLGPIGAFCVQLLMQLLTLGEDKALSADEQQRLSEIVDERVRYLWDLSGVAVLALLICLAAGTLDARSEFLRTMLCFGIGLAGWTALLASRLPGLYGEIRNFRWRLARERNKQEAYKTAMTELKADNKPEPDVPEIKKLD